MQCFKQILSFANTISPTFLCNYINFKCNVPYKKYINPINRNLNTLRNSRNTEEHIYLQPLAYSAPPTAYVHYHKYIPYSIYYV